MSFRDDHDAAICRITALEHELEDAKRSAQETSARDDRRIGMLQREIETLRRHDPPAPRKSRAPTARIPDPVPIAAQRGPAVSHGVLACFAVLAVSIIIAVLVLVRGGGTEPPPADRHCVVRAAPTQAHVFGIAATGREIDLGETPVDMALDDWQAYSTLQFRALGYDPLTVDAPRTPAQCAREPYDLYVR